MGRRARKRTAGFTVVEMMMVVLVAAVLAGIAAPGFTYYILRAKRTEAVVGLHQVWDLQQAYAAGHDGEYADDFDALGFAPGHRIDERTARGDRYTYRISKPWGPDSWYCSATANLDGDDWPDVLITGVKP